MSGTAVECWSSFSINASLNQTRRIHLANNGGDNRPWHLPSEFDPYPTNPTHLIGWVLVGTCSIAKHSCERVAGHPRAGRQNCAGFGLYLDANPYRGDTGEFRCVAPFGALSPMRCALRARLAFDGSGTNHSVGRLIRVSGLQVLKLMPMRR